MRIGGYIEDQKYTLSWYGLGLIIIYNPIYNQGVRCQGGRVDYVPNFHPSNPCFTPARLTVSLQLTTSS